jgi:hypothetical protein
MAGEAVCAKLFLRLRRQGAGGRAEGDEFASAEAGPAGG